MEAKTKAEYISIAENFINKYVGADQVTPKRITDALKARAGNYRPDYWRRLRRGLALHQREQGFIKSAERIERTKNPVTLQGVKSSIKPKQKRAKSIKPDDFKRMMQEAEKQGLHQLAAAMFIAIETGARPAEIPNIVVMDKTLAITGVKKRDGDGKSGARGLDRNITYTGDMGRMTAAIKAVAGADMSRLQGQIRKLAADVWPKRSVRPSFYTFRHQVGSNLKASGMSRVQVAYVMGHQSTVSVERYGNVRSASSPVRVEPDAGADLSVIRDNHTPPPDLNRGERVQERTHTHEAHQGPSM